MKTITLAIGIAAALGSLVTPAPATAWDIFVSCEYPKTSPTGPQPNIVCEFTWGASAQGGLTSVRQRFASWNGVVFASWNVAIRDNFDSGIFDMSVTPQPKRQWIKCADLSGIYTLNVIGIRYQQEGLPFPFTSHYYQVEAFPDVEQGVIGAVPCAG